MEAEKQGETESVHRPTYEEGGLKPSSVEQVDLEVAKVYGQPVDDHHAKNDRPPVSGRVQRDLVQGSPIIPYLSTNPDCQHLASHQTSGGSLEKVPALPQHLIGQGETKKRLT